MNQEFSSPQLQPWRTKSFSKDWTKISKYVQMVFSNESKNIRVDKVRQIVYRQCSENRVADLVNQIKSEFGIFFTSFLQTTLEQYDLQSENVYDLAKQYINNIGSILPTFQRITVDFSSIFCHISRFRGNYNLSTDLSNLFIEIFRTIDSFKYIYYSIAKLFDLFLDQFNSETFQTDKLFLSVHSTKDLLDFVNSGSSKQTFYEILTQQSQDYFEKYIERFYQYLKPPSAENSGDSNSHQIGYNPLPNIIDYINESFRLINLDYEMLKEIFDAKTAEKVQTAIFLQISGYGTETMKFVISKSGLFLQNRNYDQFAKLYELVQYNQVSTEQLCEQVSEMISMEPLSLDKLPEVISFYGKVASQLFGQKKIYKKYATKIEQSLIKQVNSDWKSVLKEILKHINESAMNDANIENIIPVISLIQMRTEFEIMNVRNAAKRIIKNRNSQLEKERSLLRQLEKVAPPLQLEGYRSLLKESHKSLSDGQYGPFLIVNSSVWPFKPPFPSPINLIEVTNPVRTKYVKNNPAKEIRFPINFWIVNVKDTQNNTVYNGTGVQAEILLYFNTHSIITDTSLEPRISQSYLSAALKAMSNKSVPALINSDGAYSINYQWKHDKIVKLKAPAAKDEIQSPKEMEKMKSNMIEASIVKIMKGKRIMKFSELDEAVKQDLALKMSIGTDDIKKHTEILINKGYIEEMNSGRLAYIP